MASRQDLVVRFIGDTGNLVKSTDQVSGRLQAVATGLKGIAAAGAVVAGAAYFKHAIDEAREAAKMTRQTEQVIRSTGGAANITAREVDDLAMRLSRLSGVDDELIAHGENVLLTFTKVRNEIGRGNDIFNQASELALDMTAALGSSALAGNDLQGSVTRIGKALNDPVKGLTALAKVGVTFTTEQKEQVKALVESGDLLAAQKIILAELRVEYGGMAAASADAGSKLQVAWDNLAEDIGNKVMPAFNAVSTWLLEKGVPALGRAASVAGETLEPAFDAITATGRGLFDVLQDIPAPVLAGAAALGVWHVASDRVSSGIGRMTAPLHAFGSDVRTVMAGSGFEVGRFGASMQVLEDRIPTLARMSTAYSGVSTRVSDAVHAHVALSTGIGGLDGQMSNTARAMDVAGGAAGRLAGGAAGAATAIGVGLRGAAGGLVSFLGGPWGVAIGAATLGLGVWIERQQRAKQAAAEHGAKVRGLTQDIVNNGGALSTQAKEQQIAEARGKGLYDIARRIGVSTRTMTQAVLGNVDAIGQVNRAWDEAAGKQDALSGEFLEWGDHWRNFEGFMGKGAGEAFSFLALEVGNARRAFGSLSGGMLEATNNATFSRDRLLEMGISLDEVNGRASTTAESVKNVGASADSAGTSAEMFSAIIESAGLTMDEAKTDGQNLAAAIRAIEDAAVATIETEEAYEASLDRLSESIKENGKSLDIHTLKGRENRDALEDVAAKIRDMTLADIEAGVPMQEAIAKHDKRVAALQREAEKSGLNKQEAEKLIGAYSRIPKDVRTAIVTQGYEETLAKLEKLSSGQWLLSQGLPMTPANLRAVQQERRNRFASGGGVSGPGGPTSDAIPALLSDGEFVQNAAAVRYYGPGLMTALNKRMIPREAIPRFADGGMVWPFPIDVKKTKIPETSVVPGGASIAALQRFAVAQRGKLYQWGATGPSNWDCSGLVGALWALAHNLNPYQRYMTTATMGVGRYGMKQGPGKFTVYLGPGHTAANIGGLHAEAYGGNGTPMAIGRVGTPLSYYNQVMHLARGGLVGLKNNPAKRAESFWKNGWPEPFGFRDGGVLKPGQLGYNETSRPEYVFNETQLAKMGGNIILQAGVIGSKRELQNWLARALDELDNQGRIRSRR